MKRVVLLFAFLIAVGVFGSVANVAYAAPTAGILRGIYPTSTNFANAANLTDGNDSTSVTTTSQTGARYAEWVLPEAVRVSGYYMRGANDGWTLLKFYNSAGTLVASRQATGNEYVNVSFADIKRIRFDATGPNTRLYYEIDVRADEVDRIPPAIPTGLAATTGIRSIQLDWNPNTEEDFAGYNLYRNGVKMNTDLLTSTTYSMLNVEPDVPYSFQLTSVDAIGNQSIRSGSVVASAMLEEIPPTLAAENITDTTLRLSWDNVAVNYDVYQNNVLLRNTHTKYVDVTQLQPDTNYEYYIVANDKYGRKVNSNVITITTLGGKPTKPTITVTDLTHNSAVVSWAPDQHANNFSLYLDGVKILDTTSTTHTFTNLQSKKLYQVKLIAFGDTVNAETSVSFTTAKAPVPTIDHASVSKHPTDANKRELSYTASNGVTGVNVYLDGELVGTYPVEQGKIELDYTGLTGLLAKLKVEPVDPDGIPYEFETPVQSSGFDYLDQILGKFLDMLGVQRNAFVYIALASIPLLIIVAIFFFLRPRFKKQVLDKDDNKPFDVVNQSNPRAINAAQRKGYKVDDTRDERKVYQPRERKQSRAQQLGFKVVERKEQLIPVGFMGSGGFKKKVDITYERNGVQYKQRYQKGQGMVFVPKDLKNQKAHVSNQLRSFASAFGSNKNQPQGGKRK